MNSTPLTLTAIEAHHAELREQAADYSGTLRGRGAVARRRPSIRRGLGRLIARPRPA
jgi:hypothetical protein